MRVLLAVSTNFTDNPRTETYQLFRYHLKLLCSYVLICYNTVLHILLSELNDIKENLR